MFGTQQKNKVVAEATPGSIRGDQPLTGVRAHGGIAQTRWRGLCLVH